MNRRDAVPALFLAPFLLGASCQIAFDDDLQIRVRNGGSITISSVTVRFPSETVAYGDVVPGRATGYRTISRAYSYAYVEGVVDGDTLRLIPIDYVGERPLRGGRYTYELSIVQGALTLKLVRD